MDMCLGIVIIIVIIIAGASFLSSASQHAAEERKKREAEAARREAERKNRVSNAIWSINNEKENFDRLINNFFIGKDSAPWVNRNLQISLQKIIKTNQELTNDEPTERRDELVKQLSNKASLFERFAGLVTTDYPIMIDSAHYGTINKPYWNEIRQLDSKTVSDTLNDYSRWINSADFNSLLNMNPVLLPKFVWFYATEKPYSAENFKKACRAFSSIYKGLFTDAVIAEFYAIKQMGGEDVLRDRVRDMLKNTSYGADELTTIASGLMWMNAYQEENMILQHLLSSGQQMTEKAQNRLHSLSNGGGKAPTGFDVASNDKELYFDVSSLSWKDDEYTGLFENLAFQDKTLSYSLAVRDEDKELMISQGIAVPDKLVIEEKLNMALAEEYGDSAKAELVKGIALSGSGEETIDGILVESKECSQMGILVHIARIGKKLNIKFYTLFMPRGEKLSEQKQQSLSLFKRLSPTVTMWESSIKDTVLMTIQQLLNTSAQNTSTSFSTKSDEGVVF